MTSRKNHLMALIVVGVVLTALTLSAANFVKMTGSGAGGAYQAIDRFGFQSAEKMRSNFNLLALGNFGRNHYGGGNESVGVVGSSADVDVPDAFDFEIDNTSTQISGTSGIVVRMRIKVRVENAAISVTPKIYNSTDASTTTSSGSAACAATATDFSGTNQSQTLTFTAVSGVKRYRPKLTVSSNASGYQVWGAQVAWDIYLP